jgi:2-keto-4-pentenoate hydratase/2-oxohepta-3-ene-1,7-dioic acid hydratase in catechol pathway
MIHAATLTIYFDIKQFEVVLFSMAFILGNINGRAVLVDGDNYFDIESISNGAISSNPMDAITKHSELHALSAQLHAATPTGKVSGVTLGPPITQPKNCFAVGLNYKSHAAESAMELPTNPLVFTKFPSCLVGPTADVELRSDAVDYEVELVVVIGTAGKDIDASDAWSHVAGVTIGQDISDRMVQFAAQPPHFDLGKSFDTFGPIGPFMYSTDHFSNLNDFTLETRINDEVRQSDTTKNLIFDVPYLIQYLSHITTLSPGDIIFTGTPDGVGAAQGKFLRDGDVITTTIGGLGTMTNACRRVSNFNKGN